MVARTNIGKNIYACAESIIALLPVPYLFNLEKNKVILMSISFYSSALSLDITLRTCKLVPVLMLVLWASSLLLCLYFCSKSEKSILKNPKQVKIGQGEVWEDDIL